MEMLQISSIALTLVLVSTVFIFRSLTLFSSVIYSIILLKFGKLRTKLYGDQKINNDISDYPEGEKKRVIPNHVAFILDGNRRWAEKRGLTTAEGHAAGAHRVFQNAKTCFLSGVNTVSLFAFSTENWTRPKEEVDFLMSLFEKYLSSEMPYFLREKVKVTVIGNRAKLRESLIYLIQEAEKATKMFEEKYLIVAIDYSGRYDITEAFKSIATKAKEGKISIQDLNDKTLIDNEMMTKKCSPFSDPDLLIRTSGEQRISNFFLWQSAYTELYFSPIMWPDFDEAQNLEALNWYHTRQRRFT